MANAFPLISGNLSLDLVNTEVVRRGKRIDLLNTEVEMLNWLATVQRELPFYEEDFTVIEERISVITKSLRELRIWLRMQYEALAKDGQPLADFIPHLEKLIRQAPIAYQYKNEQLLAMPIGSIEQMISSIIALDALTLLASGKLVKMKHCANEACVLLFIDETGRRKWCSMKICGNRHKVANFHVK